MYSFPISLGDSFSSIFQSIGLPAVASDRTNVIVAITSLVLLPLSLLKNLDALKYTSLLGLAGTLYTAIFMAIRYLDKSYVQGGKYFAELAHNAKPVFNQQSGPLVSVSIESYYCGK
ncbi:hypothetical protein EON65_03945 [archaeon]|nr:MAG: hypothetical protein EON65_03945 [archaeon]